MKFEFFEGNQEQVFQNMSNFSETVCVNSLGFENVEGTDLVVGVLGYVSGKPKRVKFKIIESVENGFELDEDYVCHALSIVNGVRSIIIMQHEN